MNEKVQKKILPQTQMLATRIDKELHQTIKELAVKERTSVQSLVVEALCDLLKKRGVPCPVDRDK